MDTFGERLILEYHDRVLQYARMRVRAQDCEDVVGDIFLRAIERREQLKGEAGPWLFAIARSRIAEHYRKRELVMRTESPLAAPAEANGVDVAAAATAAPIERMEQAEFQELLRAKLELLPELERDVIAFKFTDGLTNTEIAQALDITPNHLGVVLHRALQKLRSAMTQEVEV